jgi:hypothetical protein|tara:strand:+ start:774 stop:968 length:195 start_codon:yes stop_codon:yes gene_type:complete
MNAELLGIITVGIVLLGVGIAIVAQSEEIQAIIQIEGYTTIGPFTSSTRTDYKEYCEIIPAACS